MNTLKTRRVVCVLLALLAASASSAAGGSEAAPAPSTAPAAQTVVIQDTGGFASAITVVAEAARASVVHIDITGTIKQAPQLTPYGFSNGPQASTQVPIRALGSGVLLDREGHIITNNHVVESADTITVQFFDGTMQKAKVVGADPSTDLAVIKVETPPAVAPAKLGDSEALKVGEWVVAIGSPRGLDWTVTAGIVSAKHRTEVGQQGSSGFADFIQTDAPINPGNSGGPLLNLQGEVIGLNSMIISQSQGSEGLGFAIPSSMVKTIAASLIKDGKVVRGDLGISFQDVTAAVVNGLKLPAGTKGAVVVEVIPDQPAAAAGLKQGDVISAYSGTAITSAFDLQKLISASRPGSTVTLEVLRGGSTVRAQAKVGDQIELARQVAAHPDYELLGLKVQSITAATAKSLGIPRVIGVIVTEVVAGSPADDASIAIGDAIFRVGTADVNDAQEFATQIADAVQSGTVLLLIRDGKTGQMGYLQVPL